MTYQIYEITGEYATDANTGQQVYDLIHPKLADNQPVKLDFAGVQVFASAFFNFAIGQLLKDLSPEILNDLLDIEELSLNGRSVLQRVIDNAKRYYSDTPYQEAVDTVMEEYASNG